MGLILGSAAAQEATTPTWDASFTNLPDAEVGVFYSVNLKDYGLDIDEITIIATNRDLNAGEDELPGGLSLDTETGVLSGIPTTEDELAVITVIASNGTFDSSADWSFRTGLSDVLVTEDFPDSASVTDVTSQLGSGDPDRSTWDSSVKLNGNGSMKQDLPDTLSYPGGASNWRVPVIGGTISNPIQLQVGEELWVCYAQRHNRAEITWRYAKNGGGQINQIKLGILDRVSTASNAEAVLQTDYGNWTGYEGLSQGNAWGRSQATACSGSDFAIHELADEGGNPLPGTDPGLPSGNGAGSDWTACQQDRARYGVLFSYRQSGREDGVGDPLAPPYLAIPFDWWYSVLFHIRRDASSDALYEYFVAPLGMDWVKIHTGNEPLQADLGALTFTNSHTDMDEETGVRPLGIRWNDALITRMGSLGIPAPGFTTSTQFSV